MCSYLVEIDDREESDWLFKTFVEKGNLIVLECFFTRIKFIYNQYHTIIFFVIFDRCLFQQMCSLRRYISKPYQRKKNTAKNLISCLINLNMVS